MIEKTPYDEKYLENINQTKEDPEEFKQLFDLEDFLYETWKENQKDKSGTVQTHSQ